MPPPDRDRSARSGPDIYTMITKEDCSLRRRVADQSVISFNWIGTG